MLPRLCLTFCDMLNISIFRKQMEVVDPCLVQFQTIEYACTVHLYHAIWWLGSLVNADARWATYMAMLGDNNCYPSSFFFSNFSEIYVYWQHSRTAKKWPTAHVPAPYLHLLLDFRKLCGSVGYFTTAVCRKPAKCWIVTSCSFLWLSD